MSKKASHKALQAKLVKLLAEELSGITVEVDHSERWDRTALTFRWAGFDGFLPEERFHRLFHCIPEDFYDEHLRGCVWVELGSKESVEDFLKLPHSEDVKDKEPQIVKKLAKAGFFDALAEELGDKPTTKCVGDFSIVRRVLIAKKFGKATIRDAILVLIRNGAYCDCEALFNAQLVQLRTG